MVHEKIRKPLLHAMWQVVIRARTETSLNGDPAVANELLDELDHLFGIYMSENDRTSHLAEALVTLIRADTRMKQVVDTFREETKAALERKGGPS